MAQMEKTCKTFEKGIVWVLLSLMMLAIVASTVVLATILFTQLMIPPIFALNTQEAIEVFGFFLMVLIGLELLESIRIYLQENRVHVEVVFLVAIIAVSRKVIIIDYNKTAPEILFGMSAVILALALGYFLVRRALQLHTRGTNTPNSG